MVTAVSWHTFLAYFKDPSNALNVYGMEYGWLWVSVVLLFNQLLVRRFNTASTGLVYTALSAGAEGILSGERTGISANGTRLLIRFALATTYWFVITQLFFASSNPLWPSQFNPSGHVFLITHGSLILWYEVFLPSSLGLTIIPEPRRTLFQRLGLVGAVVPAVAVLGLFWFMLIFTNLYFHTFLECAMGLVAGYAFSFPLYTMRTLYKPDFEHDLDRIGNGDDSEGESLAAFEQSSYSSG